MECITVLRKPVLGTSGIPSAYDIQTEKYASGKCRLCSHDRQTWIYIVLLGLFLVSFMSQVLLYLQLQDSRKDIARLQGVVDDLLEAREIDRVNLENEILTKLRANQDKAGQRVRRSRHCRVPHFFLHGHNESTLRKDHISETGVFLWRNRDVSTDYFRVQQSHSANTPYLDGIQIKQAGTYFIFAKVHVRGRKDARRAPDPAVGLSLKLMPGLSREGAVSRYLDNVFITQDDRGRNYPGFGSPKRYPVDVLELSGIYYLEREDTIYISRPRNDESNSNIMYDNRFGFAHFGGYMVEFESCHT